ncbi:ATP-grasp fold amidoligase family protein [Nocardioides sp.]|uniref:ATP-grasp fold amidoligase family protein n=1 Tax=Nocardioides sp. TaxID=35761 RepID=UPI00262F8E74|nr:ATP-grasp fold amidoligase family protein [Nocardioides sp.]
MLDTRTTIDQETEAADHVGREPTSNTERRSGVLGGVRRPVAARERSRVVRWWRLWRTRRPRTFNDKVRYKMLRDHRPLMVTFADKLAVREHVAALAGPDALPRLLHVLDQPRDLVDAALPPDYVLKPTHGSGVAVIVSAQAEVVSRLPDVRHAWGYHHVRPEMAPVEHLVALGESWLSQLYGQGPNREWAYGHVPRRLLVEELLTDAGGRIPDDYKFFVFHGTCRYVQVDRGRFDRRTQDFYTRTWEHLALSGGNPWAVPEIPEPVRLQGMLDLAEQLAEGTDFVRVDLYDLPRGIVFGELSSFPAGGDSPFEPESFNLEFGGHWTPPRRYR